MKRVIVKEPTCSQFFPMSVQEIQDALSMYVIECGEKLKEANKIEDEYTYVLENKKIENALIYGRLYSDAVSETDGKFSISKSILSLPRYFTKESVQLIFPDSTTGLFSGEIIAVRGTYINGIMNVSNTYTNMQTSMPVALDPQFKCTVGIAVGPYVDSDLKPISDLKEKLSKYHFDSVIFMGPFATDDCKLLCPLPSRVAEEAEHTAEELTSIVANALEEGISNPVFISSPDDAYGLPVVPSPRVVDSGSVRIGAGNPSTICIDDLSISFISVDSMQEIENSCDGNVEVDILQKQCSLLPSISKLVLPGNIKELSISNPHVIATKGPSFISTSRGTTVLRIPSFIESGSIAVVRAENGQVNVIVE